MSAVQSSVKKGREAKHSLKSNVFWLGLVSFFTDTSSEMIFPILPMFLTIVLKANMALVGVIEGLAESTASLLKLYSGWLSDKIGKRRILVIAGYSLSALTKPMFGFATHWLHALAARCADRIGKGIRTTPRDALIAASVKKDRGAWFGLHRMMDTLGAVVGTLIAVFILWKFQAAAMPTEQTFRIIFWLSLIPGLLAVLILFLFVKEAAAGKKHSRVALSWKAMPSPYKFFVAIASLFGMVNFSYAFFLLRAQDLGIMLLLIPLLYLLYNLFYAFTSLPAGQLGDRYGKRRMLAIGYFLFAILCWGFAKTGSAKTAWLLFALYGVFMGITDGLARAHIADLVKERQRGTALGMYNLITGILILPANLIGGVLWDRFGTAIPFLTAAVVAALAGLLLLTFTGQNE